MHESIEMIREPWAVACASWELIRIALSNGSAMTLSTVITLDENSILVLGGNKASSQEWDTWILEAPSLRVKKVDNIFKDGLSSYGVKSR